MAMYRPARASVLEGRLWRACYDGFGGMTNRGGGMGTISVEEFLENPDRLLSDAQGGEIAVVTRDGEPLFMAVPMGASPDPKGIRLEIAGSLFEREQVSIGVASRMAGLSISEMIDELGRRRIPVVRISEEEFADEMKYVRGLAGRG